VTLTGSPYEQGVEHGRVLREHIARNLEIYFHRFASEGKLTRAETLHRAGKYAEVIERGNPDYHAAMLGVAEGSGFSFEELVALNVRYEIIYYQFGINAVEDGCTSFVVSREMSSNGHVLLGQNWDWIPQVQGAVVHTVDDSGLETLSFTEAGIVGGKIGLNSEGLGLAVNGLTSTFDNWSRLKKPFHARCYEILRSSDVESAIKVLTAEPRSCSTNFVIAHKSGRAIDVEVAPETLRFLETEKGKIVHANHFLDATVLGVEEAPVERMQSRHRYKRFCDLIMDQQSVSLEDLKRFLRDHDGHPNSVCRHEDPAEDPDEHYATVTSVIMDLEEGAFHITDGPPCASEYRKLGLV
jgi:isopenicillin-N N-acyltransferase-like protein